MPRDPYKGPTPTRPNQPAQKPEPISSDETKVRCPTCRQGCITVLEAAALEEEAKRRDRCICQ